MEQRQTNTKIAGIDVGKSKLDGAVHGLEDTVQIDNSGAGFSELIAWLKTREVGRVGLEATGGYERGVRLALEAEGFEVVVHQPIEVRLAAEILKQIKTHDDLLARYRLLVSLPGFGPIVAATHVIRMPELGAMRRGQAASLIGVAPFARDSGQYKAQRFIGGGRSRPRRMLYLAAIAAKRWDPGLKAFAAGLLARGKPAKLVIVAVMRKLVEAANLVLSRGQPWVRQSAT